MINETIRRSWLSKCESIRGNMAKQLARLAKLGAKNWVTIPMNKHTNEAREGMKKLSAGKAYTKETVMCIMLGHVDAGKSTTAGALMVGSGGISQRAFEKLSD